jgi:tetratricopeptide (TPR) repeat protein
LENQYLAMDDHLKQLLLLGREHYQQREFEKAEYVLRQVVGETDRFADVFDMLGVIAHGRGDFLAAERHFEKAVSLNPNYTEAQLNLMVTYNDLGKYDRAREVYSQIRHRGQPGAALTDPFAKGKIANMHAEVGQAYLDAGMISEAIHEFERAIALCPEFADLRTRLAGLYRDSGNVELAKDQLCLALEHNARYAPARVMLGVLLLSAGDHDAAIREFESALAVDAENRSAQMYLRVSRLHREKSQHPSS